jgi:serine/threonine protein kinase
VENRHRTKLLTERHAPFGRCAGQEEEPGGAASESLGKYRLERLLATGGMGQVYLGAVQGEAGFSKPVVIKRLHPSLSADDEFVQMLIDEARITSQLIHTNICQVMDLGVAEESYFIAMEYIDGLDLSALSKRAGGSFDLDAAIFIATEMLAGLHYAHQRADVDGQPFSIVHRDISPQNILVSFEGEVKIIDFGIAKARNRLVRTETGVIKGKYLYMSPEQALGKPVDHRTDVYSAGVVLQELLLGRSPLWGLSHAEILRRVADPRPEPLHRHRSDVPHGLTRVLRKALMRDPAGRYASAEEFQAALQEWGALYSRTDLARYMCSLFPEHTTSRRDLTVRDVDPCGETVTDSSFPSETTVETRQPFGDTELTFWTQAAAGEHRTGSPSRPRWDPTRWQTREEQWPVALHQAPTEVEPRPARDGVATRQVHDVEPRLADDVEPRLAHVVEPRLAHDVVEPPILPRRDLRADDEELAAAVQARRRGFTWLVLAVTGVALLGGAGLLVGSHVQQHARVASAVDGAPGPRDAALAAVDLTDGEDGQQPGRWRTMVVRSRPAGARIRLCGRRLGQTTPARVRLRPGRRCRLTLELDGYLPHRTVARTGRRVVDAHLRRRAALRTPDAGPPPSAPTEGRLRVVSVHGAVVYVDGRKAGLAPGFERTLPAGRHRVRLFFTALDRSSPTRIVIIRAGEVTSLRFGP